MQSFVVLKKLEGPSEDLARTRSCCTTGCMISCLQKPRQSRYRPQRNGKRGVLDVHSLCNACCQACVPARNRTVAPATSTCASTRVACGSGQEGERAALHHSQSSQIPDMHGPSEHSIPPRTTLFFLQHEGFIKHANGVLCK